MKKTNNWVLKDSNGEDSAFKIFDYILRMFNNIFGTEIMSGEECIVYNDTDADCPMLVTNAQPIKIRVNLSDYNYWCQYIFQLSHELTHYAIRQMKKDKEASVTWFEETIAEAMSLYILGKASNEWHLSPLYNDSPGYNQALINYKQKIYEATEESVLSLCKSIHDLEVIDNVCTVNRNSRSIERNYLLKIFEEMPTEIRAIVYYTQFIKDNILIDFERWEVERESDKLLVERLKAIQPKLSA